MPTEELGEDAADIAISRVLRDDGSADPAADPFLPSDVLLRGYREMRRLRLLELRMLSLQREGRVGFYAAARGEEAVPIAAALALLEGDWVFPASREPSTMLARGFPLRTFVAQIFGNAGDVLKGRQMPSHQSARAVNQASLSSCAGRQLPQAVGVAWAMRMRGASEVAVAFCRVDATSQPDFHAAMNLAGVWRVPCVIVCQSDDRSTCSSPARQTASRTIAVKARAYGMPGVRVDGSDLLAIYAVAREAIDRARSGGGPSLIEAVTHGASARQDALERLRLHLVKMGHLTDVEDGRIEAELAAEIGAAVTEAEALPPVDPASLVGDVFAAVPWHLREQWQIWKGSVGAAERGRR
jgi:pyruvate dehydrogenase E1 component subunit alpha